MDTKVTDAFLRAMLALSRTRKMSPRSYQLIRQEVAWFAESFTFKGSAKRALHDLIRRRFGCHISELFESDVGDVLAFLAEFRPRYFQYLDARAKFAGAAIKVVFGAVGEDALEFGPEEAFSEMEPLEMPTPPVECGDNVVRFPGSA
ncbi:MAG TPA: hypothetical protein VJ862_09270 [Rhodanobacteraceae bacterium]|nr:hypothetical protein [Rhodanobacteraceae bacterium]